MTRKRVLVPLLPGFEEIEAVTIVDVLRRAGIEVLLAGEAPGPVRGAHDIVVETQSAVADHGVPELDMVVLPGGMPGASNLAEHAAVQGLLKGMVSSGKPVAAMCAAPMALGAAGLLADRTATCYPGFEGRVHAKAIVDDRVVIDGLVTTSRGPGTALEFALALVEQLQGTKTADELEDGMLVAGRSAPRRM